MAISPKNKYPTQIDLTDPTGYPEGKAKNVTVAGDGTGTPLEKDLVNDIFGFQQELLNKAGLSPSGNPDKVGASQYKEALDKLYKFKNLTTQDLISNPDLGVPVGQVIETVGYTSIGDGGGSSWKRTGNTIAVSQTPAQTGKATLSDANGNEFELQLTNSSNDYAALGYIEGSIASDFGLYTNILIEKIDSFGAVYFPAGDLYCSTGIDTEQTTKKAVAFHGAGKGISRLHPTDAFTGWILTINDTWKSSEAGGPSTDVDNRGSLVSNFSIIGNRATNASGSNGIRTLDRVDNAYFSDVEVSFLTGTGLSLGNEGSLGLCRESNFFGVTVRECGQNSAAPGGEVPCFIISTGESVADGSNHLYFYGTRILFNRGPARIIAPTTPTTVQKIRRIYFDGMMLHGISGAATDLMVITGYVEDVKLDVNTNTSDATYACVRTQAADGFTPNGININGSISAANGDGIVFEEVNASNVDIRSTPSLVAGDLVRYDPNSLTVKNNYLKVRGQESTNKINIDPSVSRLVTQDESFGYTLAELTDISHNVNTANKYTGKPVFEVGNVRKLYASNGTAGGTWRDSSGAVVITPV